MTITEERTVEVPDITVEEREPDKCDGEDCPRDAQYVIVLGPPPCEHVHKRRLLLCPPCMKVCSHLGLRCSTCKKPVEIKDIWRLR